MEIKYSALNCYLLAGLCLLLPMDWVFAVLIAAAFHELCHIIAVRIMGGNIYMLRIETHGAVLNSDAMDHWKMIFCILAGPVGSMALLLFADHIPRVSFCGMIQGCYNLLPIYPLDGGRLLRYFAELFFSEKMVHIICTAAEYLSSAIIFVLGMYGSFVLHLGMIPFLTAMIFLYRLLCGKISCKEGKVRVQ